MQAVTFCSTLCWMPLASTKFHRTLPHRERAVAGDLKHHFITLKLGRAKVDTFRRFGVGVRFAEGV